MKSRLATAVICVALLVALSLGAGAAPMATVTVRPGAMNGWGFANDLPGTGTGRMVLGPGVPPMGEGSAEMSVADAAGGFMFGIASYGGTPLSQITALQYDSYQPVGSGASLAPAFQINIDYDLTDANTNWQGRLVFEPYLSGTVQQGVWQTWTPLTGLWWGSGAPGSTLCPMGAPCTWAQVLTNWPNAGVHTVYGGVLFKVGSGWVGGFTGNVDALSVTAGGVNTLYDFEPATTVYVDAAWAGTAIGADPDGAGPATMFGSDAFDKIQDGLNAVATGGTVNVAAGTYAEQLDMGRDVTLTGAGEGVTIVKSPATLTGYTIGGSVRKPVVYVHGATATIEQLTVDGDGQGNANYAFIGVAYHNAGGTVDHVTITQVRDTLWSGTQHGVGMYARNEDAVARTLNVTNNTIIDFQKNGMALVGDGLTVNVTGNTVTGNGPTAITAQNGIQVSGGAGGTVASNIVSDISYTPSDWTATGILVYGPGITDTTGNTITDCKSGIYYISGGGDISGNTVTASAAHLGTGQYDGIIASDPPRAVPSPFDAEAPGGAAGGHAPLAVMTVTVYGNTVTGGGDSTDSTGISAWAGYSPEDVAFDATGNTISGWGIGLLLYQEGGAGQFTSASVTYNSLTGNTYGLYAAGLPFTADGVANWWGCIDGPGAAGCDTSTGAFYSPWLGNWPSVPGNNTYYVDSTSTAASVNGLIDLAAPGDLFIFLPGTFTPAGGYLVDYPGLTFQLLDGVILQPSSPCFTVTADNTTITGGVCEPSDGSNGIETGAVVNGLVISRMEIRGSAGGDGIHLGHNVTNLQVLDNYVHGLGGDGLEYGSGVNVGGVHEVQGNLFQDNTGYGVNNVSGTAYEVDYNSWGDLAGPTGPDGDGASSDLDYTPWTHVGLSMVSSGSPVPDIVGVGLEITYTVRMDAAEVYGADFDLSFNTANLTVVRIVDSGAFLAQDSCRLSTVAEANASGVVSFCGYRLSALNGAAQSLYQVVFQGTAAGVVPLDLDETTDRFSMAPPFGASNNIYAAELLDGSVTVASTHTVTGRLDLQGRADDTGAVMQFQPGSGSGYGPFVFSTSDYWGTISATGVVADTYPITVSMDRYLDVTLASSKSVAINAAKTTLNTLTLFGGDADDNDEIKIADATIIGGQYGNTGGGITDPRADINADGTVNLLDLVLMGGNFDKTSATAYGGWTP